MVNKNLFTTGILILFFGCQGQVVDNQNNKTPLNSWTMLPFVRENKMNPVLLPSPASTFFCPLRGDSVHWEEKDVFNPAAVIRNGKVYLIYRAEDVIGRYKGTSRIGLAVSEDGFHFKKNPSPVLFPKQDFMKQYEWEGGVEDPRIVETEDGRYILTYTSYDGKTARLCLASSTDLKNWVKHGLVLGEGKYRDTWSKSGAIVCRRQGDKLLAAKINGKYWMYWGDKNCYAATSADLIHWTPLETEKGSLKVIFGPRPGKFDSRIVESGPAPLLTGKGIVFIYNGSNLYQSDQPNLPPNSYSSGQILLDKKDPTKVLGRLDKPFLRPEMEYEIQGQVAHVVFLEGLVPFHGKWFLYYGTADSKIAVAVMEETN